MYYDSSQFPFTRVLEQNWRVIRDEMDALETQEFIDWPEHTLYGERGWQTFGLYAFGQRQPAGCARCPQTERLVRNIPGLMMAGFSRLAPGAHIVPHRGYEGYAGYVLRFHLGLQVPQGCAMRVGPETRSWIEGGSLVFDDSTEHEAWNNSNQTRTILLCDFLNPLRRRPLILNPKFTPELIGYIERDYLPTRGLGQRLLWHVWKLANPGLVRQARQNVAVDHPP
ncbi:MAG TPA: aspartyl/asparaginyl beta-hydroxylase domain-containing protein [Longimicrobiales bacterium]|nr:aspartyl/asparaginyl beta-hydroxylase domain-containing protein [Longimicrobiales bacterium]